MGISRIKKPVLRKIQYQKWRHYVESMNKNCLLKMIQDHMSSRRRPRAHPPRMFMDISTSSKVEITSRTQIQQRTGDKGSFEQFFQILGFQCQKGPENKTSKKSSTNIGIVARRPFQMKEVLLRNFNDGFNSFQTRFGAGAIEGTKFIL